LNIVFFTPVVLDSLITTATDFTGWRPVRQWYNTFLGRMLRNGDDRE
jgi:hypothetical protein